MNVFITGGAGFIGSHLAERCLAEGWQVAVLDDLSTGAVENIAHLKAKPAFSFRIESVFNESVVAEMVDCADIVFHLAAAVGVRQIVNNLVTAIRTNVEGAAVVLRCAAKKGKQVMLASTSEVYGKSTRLPFRETDDLVLGPTKIGRWSYAVSKALDECLGMAYWSEQRRCFPYVGDVAEALVRLAQAPAAVGEIVNVGNDQEVTINELATLVREITGSPSRLEHLTYDQAYGPGFEDMERRVPCLEKLESLVRYRPTTPLDTIVRRVVD